MIRLFVALPLPDDLAVRLVALGCGVDGAHWVSAENLHITLRFIGEVSEPVVDDIAYNLDTVSAGPISVTLAGAGQFASRGRTRGLWIGVNKSPDLEVLRNKVDIVLVRAGLQLDGRKYIPHVTIGRIKNARRNRVIGWLRSNSTFVSTPFSVPNFVLYQSRIGRNGPNYLPIANYRFASAQ
ncbi:MAG: RNA 2',3'-cyclic phosphodiesterase [Alphaproteobacteria bacterium MarineAlpha11_Bin1]|nr:MAG: RNA 2',3'-cyclic phosphodiesterase [Alphaproteobacteria bacterium MarineAlpha11_Bin1]|tara:strand:- start:14050 stop:14595 length:546 start_codon:yes stop_codon:yes gene_type:complete